MAPSKEDIKTPIAAAHLYLPEPGSDYVQGWKSIRFELVDVLYISPFIVKDSRTGAFGIADEYASRAKDAIQVARAVNTKIKILGQQWWSEKSDDVKCFQGLRAETIDHYAKTVGEVVTGLGLDGYDCDYEAGNDVELAPKILAAVRASLNALSGDGPGKAGRRLYTTISPDRPTALDPTTLKRDVDFVNIQTYDGGFDSVSVDLFRNNFGFPADRLLLGILPEQTRKPGYTPTKAEQTFTQEGLAGIHLWRLNSHNQPFENRIQARMHDFVHATNPKSDGYDAEQDEKDYTSHRWDYDDMKRRGEIQ